VQTKKRKMKAGDALVGMKRRGSQLRGGAENQQSSNIRRGEGRA